MKVKTILSGLVFLAVPLLANAAPHSPGTNIMPAWNGSVWTITDNGQRRAYTSAAAFLSYGFNNWNTVVQANTDDWSLPSGDYIPPRDGKIICSDRGTDEGTCYLITNGKKAGFTNQDVFVKSGFNFKNVLYGDVSFLPTTDNIGDAAQAHLPGTLINDNGTIKLVGSGGNVTVGVPSMNILNSWGYSLADVVNANGADQRLQQNDILGSHAPGALVWYDGAPPVSSTTPSPNPTPTPSIPAPTNLPAIVSEWQNRVAIVLCTFTDSSTLQGSALITSVTGYGTVAVTNNHVLNSNGITPPKTCSIANNLGMRTVGDPGGPQQGLVSTIFFQPLAGVDMAYIKLGTPLVTPTDSGAFDTLSRGKVCNQNDVTLGDSVLVLGYPVDGSQSSVTATQGIVSGFDGNYIVTDAKIDHGNSGGAAILVKDDCYLGIPSAAVVGSIESYGRILKSSFVFGN